MQDSDHKLAASALLTDPAALRQAWADLVAGHPHLHGPEVAARLGVPEAAMLAARVGHGAVELKPDLLGLLASCSHWGKVLLAARNRLGVALLIMDDPRFESSNGHITLQTRYHLAVLATQGVQRCYLFEERDHHGHTFSLNWFDAQGHVIGRLFLMSKSGREYALPVLRAMALPHQRPVWQAGMAQPPSVVSMSPEGLEGSAMNLKGATMAEWAEAAVLACPQASQMCVTLDGRGLAVRYEGPLGKGLRTPGAVHASDAACKLHLRMAGCAGLQRHEMRHGAASLVIEDGDGGHLRLQAGTNAEEANAWLDRWMAAGNAMFDGGTCVE